jgi:hypothetical protein
VPPGLSHLCRGLCSYCEPCVILRHWTSFFVSNFRPLTCSASWLYCDNSSV